MKELVISAIEKAKIIAIIRGVERTKLIPLCEALYKGGIRLAELTYCADESVSDEEMADRLKMLNDHFEGKMLLGSGTVLTEKQVELTRAAGGTFVISPDTYENVIRRTNELGLVSIPGAMTPTEIQAAHRYGADFVKVFPCSVGGADYIKGVKAPLSHIKLLAVGGVDTENIKTFLKAGACGIGIGSGIIDKKAIETGDFEKIRKLAKNYVEALSK